MTGEGELLYRLTVVRLEAEEQFGLCVKLEYQGCYPPYVHINGLPLDSQQLFHPGDQWEIRLTRHSGIPPVDERPIQDKKGSGNDQ